MYKWLYKYLESKSNLCPSQYGFCSKRSCEQATSEPADYILQAKNHEEHSACVYFDLSKAFDTLDHSISIQKLERYGICGVVEDWFEDYLKDRSLVTKITTSLKEVTKSDTFNVTCGAAQGSCLGPLLFIIFVNDIHLLPLYNKVILFTDDTTIFNSNKARQYLQYMMESDLNLMKSWFNANKLSLNIVKTVAMKFWDQNDTFNKSVNGQQLPLVKCTKFLGVYMDNMLSWHHHISHVIDKHNNNMRLLLLGKRCLNVHC